MPAGQWRVDIGQLGPFYINKTDYFADEPSELLQPIRIRDEDDPTNVAVAQAGDATEDYHYVKYSQLSDILARGHLHAFFPDIVIVTPDGYDIVLYASGTTGATVTIYEVQITGTPQGSSGSTTILANANTKASGTTTNSISCSMAASATSAKAAGSFELTVGDPLYVHITASASHQHVNVNIAYKGGGTA